MEIGPGQAALTRELVGGAGHVNAVEIDRDLAAWLKTQFAESELTLIEANALTLDWTAVAGEKRMRVVGNLPYNISSPLLFHLMKAASCVIDQHFMLQREVVDRMTAAPGTKTYGRLSVMLQWRYKMHKLFDVPPGAFTPAPKVVSSVVRMIPRRAEEVLPVDFDMALFGRCQRLRTAPKNAQKCALSPFNGRGNPRGRRGPPGARRKASAHSLCEPCQQGF